MFLTASAQNAFFRMLFFNFRIPNLKSQLIRFLYGAQILKETVERRSFWLRAASQIKIVDGPGPQLYRSHKTNQDVPASIDIGLVYAHRDRSAAIVWHTPEYPAG